MEHWNLKDGKLQGLYTVNAELAEGDIWDKLDQVIASYTKLHPMEMEAVVRQNGWVVKTRLNQYGSTSTKLRYSLSMPVALLYLCERVEPKIFTKQYLHKFMKRYKGLRVCQTV